MTPALPETTDRDRVTLVFLHCLGGSARAWTPVIDRLRDRYDCLPIDLPGFGDAAAAMGFTVESMAGAVERAVAQVSPARWLLVGHSMGAKIAVVLARRAEDGAAALHGLDGLVLLGGSPPGPEPMGEDRRQTMLGWFAGSDEQRLHEARSFIDANISAPLPDPLDHGAIDDVLQAHRNAWRAWLAHGSREDWTQRIGVLRTPALVVAGEKDGDLGPEAQKTLVGPHFVDARHVVIAGAKHLLPLERPDEVARLIADHVQRLDRPKLDPGYRALIASDRVSTRTRNVLLKRLAGGGIEGEASCLTPAEHRTLDAVLRRIVPQQSDAEIDIAAILERNLTHGLGDGWRFAALPPDAEACSAALRTLDALARQVHAAAFAHLDDAAQDGVLERIAAGETGPPLREDGLSGAQMALWFEDLRGAAAQAYMSHPLTLARIGFSGIANGGDGPRKQGFVRVGAGEPEPWEPHSLEDARP